MSEDKSMIVDRDSNSSKLSFSIKLNTKTSKVSKESLHQNIAGDDEFEKSQNDDKDFVISVGDKQLESKIPKKKKEQLVIPLIEKNKWRLPDKNNGDELNNEAVSELLEELRNEGNSDDAKVIQPILMQNRLPKREGAEDIQDDMEHDLAIRPEQSTYKDYEDIPITAFGTAMLRGMGWSEGKGIGLTNQSVIEPMTYIPRHKGLGLGAERRVNPKQNNRKRKLGEKVADESNYTPIIDEDGRVRHRKGVGEQIKKQEKGYYLGSYVQIQKGPHKELYGEIASVDEDTARISVKLALSAEVIHISQYKTVLVDTSEYKKQATRRKSIKSDVDRGEKDEGKRKKQNTYEKESSSVDRYDELSWIIAGIKVRVISKSFRKGILYNKKVEIVDVVSKNRCTCRTEEGRYLEDMHQKDLETVIPKKIGSYVCVVDGKYKGKFGKVLERNSKDSKAVIQLTSNKHVTTTSYYDISEYVGRLPDDEFL